MIGLGALVTALLTWVICPPLIRELRRRVVMDVPIERSSHSIPTPRGGGLAPAIGASVGLFVAVGVSSSELLVVAAVAAAFGAVGLADDVSTIRAERRILVQLAIAAAGAVPLAMGVASGFELVALIPAGVLWLVAYVNAFNFMDGINGISAMQVVVAGSAWAIVGVWHDDTVLTAGGLVVLSAALAFMPFNYPLAKVFLGDIGSYFFGGWLGAMAFVSIDRGLTLEMAVAPLVLSLCDTGITLVRRFARHAPLTEAHREHTYQRLAVGGWSHTRTTVFVGVLIALSSMLGGATMIGSPAIRGIADSALVLLMVGYITSPSWQERRSRVQSTRLILEDYR